MKKLKFLVKPLIIVASFIIIGLIIMYFLDISIKKDFSAQIEQASNVSLAAVNPEKVRNLSAIIPGDITGSADYVRLREQITKLGKTFSGNGIDAIYLLTKKGDKIYFIVESTPADQPDAVTPGVLYEKPPQEIYGVFAHGVAQETDVYRDEYGEYLSQFSPIVDSISGEQVGVLGVDVNYTVFQKSYYQKIFTFLIIWSVICALFIFLYLYFKSIYKLNVESRISNEKINSISDAISDMIVVIDNKSLVSFWNKTAEKALHSSAKEIFGAKFSDLAIFENVFDLKLEKEIRNFNFSFNNSLSGKIFELKMSIHGQESNYYEASFKITEVNGENYLVGVFHDISKRKNIEIELKKQKTDLEKINQLMVGRELKMLELKKEISGLKNKE